MLRIVYGLLFIREHALLPGSALLTYYALRTVLCVDKPTHVPNPLFGCCVVCSVQDRFVITSPFLKHHARPVELVVQQSVFSFKCFASMVQYFMFRISHVGSIFNMPYDAHRMSRALW